jgi:hypothetical protein
MKIKILIIDIIKILILHPTTLNKNNKNKTMIFKKKKKI